jgi:hypothetical protein
MRAYLYGGLEEKKSDIQHQLEDIIPEVAFSNIKASLKMQEIHGVQL